MKTDLRDIFGDPARRRSWLLAKALEHAPLREALAHAREAEAFLTGTGETERVYHPTVLELSTLIH
jgi:uncharacterized protein